MQKTKLLIFEKNDIAWIQAAEAHILPEKMIIKIMGAMGWTLTKKF